MSVKDLPDMQIQRLNSKQECNLRRQDKHKHVHTNMGMCIQTQCIQQGVELPPMHGQSGELRGFGRLHGVVVGALLGSRAIVERVGECRCCGCHQDMEGVD